jgi:YD repeat-containing protein
MVGVSGYSGFILGGKYEQTWAYGETGNHEAITLDGATLSFAHDESASDKGGLANEITGVNGDDGDIAHDSAGNMSKVPLAKDGEVVGHRVHTYDAWGRLVKIETAASVTIAVMQYDGLGRRIGKTITNSGKMNGTYKFFYDGQAPAGQAKLIETHNGSDQVIKHNVWGPTYVDELVQVAANTNPSVDGDMDVFRVILDDANFNIIGIMNDSHDLIERREYHAYGKRQVFVQRDSAETQ